MRAIFAIYKYFPHGGIQRDMLKMLREWVRRGHDASVLTGEWRGPKPGGAAVCEVPRRGLSNHGRYRRFHAALAAHAADEQPDLVVGMNKMPGLDVYFAGDPCYLEKAATQRHRLYRLLPRYRHFAAFERAVFTRGGKTRIFTLTAPAMDDYRRHYDTEAERFVLLPPGIDRDRVPGGDAARVRSAFRDEFGFAEHEQLLLFVGSGFRKKGLDRVLLGLRALPPTLAENVRLFVVGSDNARPFVRMAKRLGLSSRVRFFAGRDDVPRFLLGADALVLPAYDELAGMVILEAMFAGLPALVTENCGYAHYLGEAQAGIVLPTPYVQERFDRELKNLLTSPQRESWRCNGLAAARDERYFQLAPVAVDHLEGFAGERRGY